ncbi:asparagine synthase (glutamine-hydrolyzing) [Aquirufa antheringensis]|uniref:asparagine synthase (glutamine-hydrolyzing) n=1 Tax=Aquirufa antheringensis TaxID=2516559 RepID=UPI0022A8390B|nr:asparagine synthase (glutamine-hydrolyzing) [Aquirufa antheringensis]MCZ2478018.1 asparagine synthase (glutamine-hydrolyzing) [Aquirufa antheringensis]
MCGIYGVVNKFTFDEVVDKISKTSYRGPDYTGVKKLNDSIYFAHNRLAIIDLDDRSNQPFLYQNCEIVFNGEIYNYLEIKKKLIDKGYKFKTNSDTEVICASYIESGVECLLDFNGMFSFVLFDKTNNILFGARDRLGKKPLFYNFNSVESSFEFASQLSPLIFNNQLSVNWDNVAEYFFWGYNQDPNTPFNEIKKIPAGNYFKYDISRNALNIVEYWRPSINKQNYKLDYEASKYELKSLISDSVKIRLNADVPVGVFLSGGIDSSLVASIAQNLSSNSIKTFSVSFNESKYDESKYSKLVANYLQTDHYDFLCESKDAINYIINFENYFDEPLADMSSIPMLLLSSETKKHVSVALSGDGGDEIFAGYERYSWMNRTDFIFSSLPHNLRKEFSKIISKIPSYKLKLIAEGISQKDQFQLYCKMVGVLKPSIFNFDYEKIFSNVSNHWENSSIHLIESLCLFDIKTYLNNDINTKVDRSTMRFSLESRSPLMDYRVVEKALNFPLNFKFSNNNQKVILKDVLYDYLPSEFFNRPKAGFAMPFKEWFRNELKELIFDYITLENLSQIPILNSEVVMNLVQEHMEGKANNSLEIWKIIVWIKFQQKFNVS